jgi:hypothetical protein
LHVKQFQSVNVGQPLVDIVSRAAQGEAQCAVALAGLDENRRTL